MKRGREDDYMAGQLGSPVLRPGGEAAVQHQPLGGVNSSKLTTGDALKYLKDVRDIFQDKKEKYDEFLKVMKDFKAQRLNTTGVIARVKELFNGYPDLILGFNSFLPKGYKITLSDDEQKKPVKYEEAIGFVHKIQTRFKDDERTYRTFSEILRLFKEKQKSISEVYKEVSALFCEHDDMIADFAQFLPQNHVDERQHIGAANTDNGHNDRTIEQRFEREIRARDLGDTNLDHDESHWHHGVGDHQIDYGANNCETKRDGAETDVASFAKDLASDKVSLSASKLLVKPISELDLSTSRSCTPSYRLLPESYSSLVPSGRSDLAAEVLNDRWISVTSGSEDYSFKHMRKNQYEESLFRCEDDRFELDMLIKSVYSAAKRVEKLLADINNKKIDSEKPICIEEHLTVLNLRCIERLYADHGIDVMDVLKKNASIALPVILTRLIQKQEEWERCRFDFRKVWAEVYAKNHHKSLDHRSFYFKQQDLKNLSRKGLLAEIKNISEKQHKTDLVLAIAAGTRLSLMPDMEFKYSDPKIHEDLYQLIKYSCEEMCTSEQSVKVMKMWTSFLEPMLGIRTRPEGIPTLQASLVDGDVPAHKCDASQQVKEQNNEVISDEDGQAVGRYKVHREDGELSPTGSSEQDNYEVYAEADLVCNCKARDDAGSMKYHRSEEVNKSCGEAGAKIVSDNVAEFKGNVHRSSKDNTNVPEKIVSRSKFDDTVDSSHGEHDLEADSKGGDGSLVPFSEFFLRNAKPRRKKHVFSALPDKMKEAKKDSHVFYGNDSFFLLYRLHQILYERIESAKVNSEKKWKGSNDKTPSDSYARFMNALHNLIDGSYDSAKFEDECRAIIGAHSYVLFTLDKLIHKLVNHLCAVVTDATDNKLRQLYSYEKYQKPGRFVDVVYYENARTILSDQNIYRIESSSAPTRLTISLVDDGHDKAEVSAPHVDPSFTDYLHNDFLAFVPDEERNHRVFLRRNKRKFINMVKSSDKSDALEGTIIINGLQCRMDCSSSKVKYVVNTFDLMHREIKPKQNGSRGTGSKPKPSRDITRQNKTLQFQKKLRSKLLGVL